MGTDLHRAECGTQWGVMWCMGEKSEMTGGPKGAAEWSVSARGAAMPSLGQRPRKKSIRGVGHRRAKGRDGGGALGVARPHAPVGAGRRTERGCGSCHSLELSPS